MGFLDAFSDYSFKTRKDGTKIFYPWGIFGKSYIIKSESDFHRLKNLLSIYNSIAFLFILLFHKMNTILVLTITILPYTIYVLTYCKRLEVEKSKIRYYTAIKQQSGEYNKSTLWFMELFCLLCVLLSASLVLPDPDQRLTGIAGIVIFGWLSVHIAMVILAKK